MGEEGEGARGWVVCHVGVRREVDAGKCRSGVWWVRFAKYRYARRRDRIDESFVASRWRKICWRQLGIGIFPTDLPTCKKLDVGVTADYLIAQHKFDEVVECGGGGVVLEKPRFEAPPSQRGLLKINEYEDIYSAGHQPKQVKGLCRGRIRTRREEEK